MDGYNGARAWDIDVSADSRVVSQFFNTVYAWMAVGLAWTGIVAYVVSQTPALLRVIYGGGPGMMVVFALGLFGIAVVTQRAALRLGTAAGIGLFLLYATLMGALISGVFLAYTLDTLGAAFLVTGGVFAAMSIYGFMTKRDLTAVGSLATMGLFGLFVASIVNAFLASDALGWFITYGVVVVTVVIIAYQTQMLRGIAVQAGSDQALASRYAIIGSLLLYIAFINLFLSVLRIMGSRR